MRKLTALFLFSFLAAISVRADLIFYDGFQYTNGSIETNSSGLWTRESGTASPTDMIVNNSNLQVAATGGTIITRQDDCDRLFSITNNSIYTNSVQLVYASFTVICTNLPNLPGSYFASFYSTAKGYCGRIQAFTTNTVVPNTWRLAVSDNASTATTAPYPNGGYPVDLALNTPYQVVVELDPINLGAATIWVNPINVSQTGSSPAETHYTASDSLGFQTTSQVNSFAFRQASSFGNSFFVITNLAVATTFAEAATNVWTTNAVPPTIVYQPAAGVTNFPSSSITLSAVANGQGLGNMTYQWKQNGTNYTGGNGGTANVLIISSSSTNDSGNFTLVATTPYGLSVTSSVSKVSIVDGAYPPLFTAQPASQVIYKGQSATLSTTVIGPPSGGTPAFTWYSNNVVVTGIQVDNGFSSSIPFNSAATNVSATYKVAVTNLYGGIVSTNAVLSVLPIPTVSIQYLSTLVDPSTYQPTNLPPSIPYQVTGTITTFTNLTTGNSSSYYLQDGTGGINIFATFGSTFRPAQGDVVTWIGVMSTFTSGIELYADPTGAYPYTSYTDTGTTNALPTPITISYDVATNLNILNTNIQGSLVKLSDCYFGTNAGTALSTTANNTITVTNSSGKKLNLFFAFLDLDTAGKTLPSYAYSVTGVMYGQSTNSLAVAVTRFSDIVTNATITLTPIPLGINYSGGNVTFSWTNSSFALQSSTNVVGPYVTITNAASGFIINATTSAPTMFFRLYHP
jgi:hypothetical protein